MSIDTQDRIQVEPPAAASNPPGVADGEAQALTHRGSWWPDYALASWLWRIGYRPWLCGFVLNADCSERALEHVERRVVALHRRTGRRVAVFVHTRGGHYARAIAPRRPDLVSRAVCLGADLQAMSHCSARALTAVEGAQWSCPQRTGSLTDWLAYRCRCAFAAHFRAPLPVDRVRLTSIYSRGDGVFRWRTQRVRYAACVEVSGCHNGLSLNRNSYRAIATALAAPELRAP